MPQTMTLDEKLAISNKACALWKAGDEEEYNNLMKKMPIPPFLAKVLKEKVGADIIKIGGWDLSEVEAEFGPDWINS
jgi:protein associated with RNAse G/E